MLAADANGTGAAAGEEEDAFVFTLRRHLCLNWMWQRLGLGFRCLAVLPVTLLDLKNLAPSHMTGISRLVEVYAVVRLKHASAAYSSSSSSSGDGVTGNYVTPRSRTLDSQLTEPCRIDRSQQQAAAIGTTRPSDRATNSSAASSMHSGSRHSGGGSYGGSGGGGSNNVNVAYDSRIMGSPWGSHVQFRLPLPDEVMTNRQQGLGTYTRGPPQVLYIGVYQKRPMIGDAHLGDIEVSLSSLSEATPLEQWLPLRHSAASANAGGAAAGLAAVSGANQQWFLHFRAAMSIIRVAKDG